MEVCYVFGTVCVDETRRYMSEALGKRSVLGFEYVLLWFGHLCWLFWRKWKVCSGTRRGWDREFAIEENCTVNYA
jgi:hypothetical protein